MKSNRTFKIQLLALIMVSCGMASVFFGANLDFVKGESKNTVSDGFDGEFVTVETKSESEITSLGDFMFDSDQTTASANKTTVAVTKESKTNKDDNVVQLPKIKIKKVIKKKSAKSIKVYLKAKVKKADGYIVKVYTKKKYAKNDKKIYLKKKVKKNKKTFVVKSKRLKNRKKLFVRINAYKIVKGKLKIVSKNSGIKKIKINK